MRRSQRSIPMPGKKPDRRPADPVGAPRPSTWIERLREALQRGDTSEALRIAAAHIRAGEGAEEIGDAWEALQRPAFQRQLGRDPDAMAARGIEIIVARFA
jgi:hypothetical protein